MSTIVCLLRKGIYYSFRLIRKKIKVVATFFLLFSPDLNQKVHKTCLEIVHQSKNIAPIEVHNTKYFSQRQKYEKLKNDCGILFKQRIV